MWHANAFHMPMLKPNYPAILPCSKTIHSLFPVHTLPILGA
jgi:hypothetical protein